MELGRGIFDRLLAAFGPQHWWPAQTPTEMAVGAILTQNTAWNNVERALANLKRAQVLSWRRLHALSEAQLAELIRPAGTYRVKAVRLKAFAETLCTHHGGSLTRMLAGKLEEVRARLLDINGIGPETADALLLYAGGHPSFVVDAYTKRILRRHFLIDSKTNYDDVRRRFHQALEPDPALFNEYHALLVELGKRHCRVQARCAGCPLEDLAHDEDL